MNPRLFALLFFSALCLTAPGAQTTAQGWNDRGRASLAREDYIQALEDFRGALKLNPNYLEAHEGLAEAFFALGDFEEAGRAVTEAVRLGTGLSRIQVLQGRVFLGQGKSEEALKLFQAVLVREPKNLGAFFGRAEYYVLTGRFVQAGRDYGDILKTDPGNLRARLALIILGLHQNRTAELPGLVEGILRDHSTDPLSHWWAAQYFRKTGQLTRALDHTDNYLRLKRALPPLPAKEGIRKGLTLRTVVLLDLGRNQEAAETASALCSSHPQDPYAWYLKGLAEISLTDREAALSSFRRSLRLDGQNETVRIALENILLVQGLESLAQERAAQSEYRFEAAQQALNASRLTLAYDEVRRGLQMDPQSPRGLKILGDIFKIQGFLTSYRDVLSRLKIPEGPQASVFSDEKEIQQAAYPESLPALWGIPLSAFESQKARTVSLGIFYQPRISQLEYHSAAEQLTEFFQDELAQFRIFELRRNADLEIRQPEKVEAASQAYMTARREGLDFYLIMEYREGFRDITAAAHLYHGASGRLIQSFPAYRKGLGRVSSALRDLSKTVRSYFPLWGYLVSRKKEQGLISLGSRDGVTSDMEFRVLRKDVGVFTGDSSQVRYSAADTLGTFKVTAADDRLSEGLLSVTGFYDLITPGDEVLFVPVPRDPVPVVWPSWSELQRSILNLR